MLRHPVGRCLAKPFCVFVYERLLVVEHLCVVDEALNVAFDLGEVLVLSGLELALRMRVSNVISCGMEGPQTSIISIVMGNLMIS